MHSNAVQALAGGTLSALKTYPYSQTTPILRFFPDYSQSQMTYNLTSLPAYSLLSVYLQATSYPQISPKLLPMLKLFPDYSSPHAQIISRLLPDFPNLRLLQD